MANLPQPATIRYSSFFFNRENTTTLEMSATPVYSTDQRSVIYIVYRIVLETLISVSDFPLYSINTADTTTDNFFTRVRKVLTQPGQAFVYKDNGFGNISVNVGFRTASQPADVIWGPKPRILSWIPKGAQEAAEMKWTVEVAIPECDSASFFGADNWLELNTKVSYALDTSGYTTRTFGGFVRVPQTRSTRPRKIEYSADEARAKIYPDLIPGFRRIPGTFALSDDKCRLDFSVTDVEVGPNYPPPGVVEVSAAHSVTSGKAFGGIMTGTLSATYELSKAADRSIAMGYFLQLFEQKRKAAFTVGFKPDKFLTGDQTIGGKKVKEMAGVKFAMLRSFTAAEPEIYGKKGASFTAQYVFLSSLSDLMQASGLWLPVPNNSSEKWAASLKNLTWDSRGHAQLAFNPNDDALVDLCEPAKAKPGVPVVPVPKPEAKPVPKNDIPPLQFSWLYYVCWLHFEEEDEIVELKPLPPQALRVNLLQLITTDSDTLSAPSKLSTLSPPDVAPLPPEMPAMPAPVVQRRAATSYYVYLRGYALRAGAPIPRPKLLSVGKLPCLPASREGRGEGFSHAQVGSLFGVAQYAAVWNRRYLLTGKPEGDIPEPPNPFRDF